VGIIKNVLQKRHEAIVEDSKSKKSKEKLLMQQERQLLR
jgi:hypothetical protein